MADKNVGEQAIERASQLTSNAFSKATAGAKGLASGLLDTNPQISDLTSGLGALNSVVKYLEGNLGALQGFSRYGVDFGMSISRMNQSAAGARLKLEDMAKIVSANTDFFLTFGSGINGVTDGVQNFLNSQRKFFFTLVDGTEKASESSLQLERLGLTTKNINESFLMFDAIENYRRRGERLTAEQRNASAMEFTKTLDRLSKLTGKQTEQIQKEIEAKMRQGDIAAFLTELGTDARTSFQEGISLFGTMGPAIQQLFEDQVIRGFPGEDVAPLVSMMPKTVAAFEEYRKILKTGTKEQREAALAAALSAAAQEQQSDSMRELAKLGGRVGSNVTELYSRVFGQSAYGLAEAIRQVQDEFRKEGKNVDLAGADFLDRVKKRQEEIMRGPKKPDGTVDPERAAVDALIKIQQTASEMAIVAQRQIGELYKTLGSSADKFAEHIRSKIDIAKEVNTVVSTIREALGLGGSDVRTALESSARATANAIAANSPELAGQINTLITKIEKATDAERPALIEELNTKIREATSMTWEAQNVRITANGPVTIDPTKLNPQALPPDLRPNAGNNPEGRDTGSLGKTGRLFENFGKQSNMLLHGIESVQTPEQTADIMRNSALGALQAVDDIFNAGSLSTRVSGTLLPAIENMAANNIQTLNGMLNTMQNNSRQMTQAVSGKELDFNELTKSFKTAMIDIKRPIEDVAKSLKEPMEQLAQTAGQQLEIQQKQLRGINGLSNDALRGLA